MHIERGQALSALSKAVRRSGLTVIPIRAYLAGRVLISVADLTLAQLGIPGAVGCCEYLVGRWKGGSHRTTSGKNTSTHPDQTVPVSGTNAIDHEGS